MGQEQAADEPDPFWAERIRGDLLSALRKTGRCLHGTSLSARDIHRGRRHLKDSNALALLFVDAVGPQAQRAARDLRGFRRQLGAARDLDVISEALEGFAPDLSEDLVGVLRARLDARRKALRADVQKIDLEPLRSELNRTAREIGRWSLAGAGGDRLLSALERSYRKARRRGAAAYASFAPADLHALRKAVIVHRGQLAAFDQIWPKLVHGWCSEAQHLREDLGRLNDLSLLVAFASEGPSAEADAALLRARIEDARTEALARAEPTFHRLFCERPKDMARRLQAWIVYPKKPLRPADQDEGGAASA